jgi:peptidoglycan/LPS O-acetylase OafA/YrhL
MPTRRNHVDLDRPHPRHEPGPERAEPPDRGPTRAEAAATVSGPFVRSVRTAQVKGLAGACMLVVVADGLGLAVPGGHLAVDAVLVIMGFQLGLAIRRVAGTDGWRRRYLVGALGPIVVPTLVAIGLALAYWWWLDRLDAAAIRGAIAALAMVGNLVPATVDASFPATDHLWLVGLTVQFGLIGPLAVAQARRPGGGRRVVRAAVTLAAAAAVLRLVLALSGWLDPSTLAQATPTRVDGLALGAAAALAPRSMLCRIPSSLTTPALVCLAAALALSPDPTRQPVVALGLLPPLVIVATASIVATQTSDRPSTLAGGLLGRLGPRWLGERAISIYIWHQLFGMALTDDGGGGPFGSGWPGFGLFVTRLVFALAAGAASYRYLQLPLALALEPEGRRSGSGRPADIPESRVLSAG